MRGLYIGLGLFVAQTFLCFRGAAPFGKYWNPVLLFAVSVAIGYYWLRILIKEKSIDYQAAIPESSWKRKISGALVGMLSMVLCYEELRKAFVKYTPPGKISDVLPQLETLFTRFINGEMPYQPIDLGTHILYPVYMPLSWLPIWISQFFNMDTRWSGYILLVVAAGIHGYFVFRQRRPLASQIAAAVYPSLALWGYILLGGADLPVSFETVIAAYYLVLASGFVGRNYGLITLGLILCLLSRFTLVFWLPLFALLFWQNESLRRNAALWLAVAVSVALLYFVPFYLKDPAILGRGIEYYHNATVLEWKGYGEPPVSWTIERGVNLAGIFRDGLGGDMEHRVGVARKVQAGVMLFLLVAGIWGYRRWRARIHFCDFSLLMLYFFLISYYIFAPLTYRYYLLVPLALSAVICGQIALSRPRS